MIRLVMVIVWIFIIWYCCIKPEYVICMNIVDGEVCNTKAKIDYRRGVWTCPKCGYGKYLKY